MTDDERVRFSELIAGVYAYHRTAVSPAIIGVFWRGCQRWPLEQVSHAIDILTADPEAGRFPPKIGDIVRVLEGTATERAALAWGKVLEAIGSVGAYQDVVFDDPAIHAVVEDLGGWPKLCRTDLAELGFLQHRFCQAHQAYVHKRTFPFPRRLVGDRSPDADYLRVGMRPPVPVLVGSEAVALQVLEGGSSTGKTSITYASQAAATLLLSQ